MGLDGLRQGAQQVIAGGKNRGGGGGGRKGNWRMRWKPPQKLDNNPRVVAEPVVFLDADYPDIYAKNQQGQLIRDAAGNPPLRPFYHGVKHVFKRGPKDIKELICSTGPDPYAPGQCIGCYEVDHGAKAPPRDFCSFNLGHLMPYHMVPLVDKQKQLVYKKDQNGTPTSELIMVEEVCGLQGCQYCQQNQSNPQQPPFPTKFGAQRYLEVGTGHLGTVLGLDAKVGSMCAHCLTNVKQLGFYCPTPGCGEFMLEVASSGMTFEQIQQFAATPVQCRRCNQVVTPSEDIDCGYDPQGLYKIQGQGCPEGQTKRLTIFDCVFYLQREGKDQQTKIVDVSWVPKSRFQTPDNRPLDEHLKEIAKAPFNFVEFYAPDNLDDQAKTLGVPNRFNQGQQVPQGYPPQGAQGYGAPQPPPGYVPPAPPQNPQYQPYPSAPAGRPNYGK